MLKFEHLRMQMSPKKGESPDVIIVSLQHDLYIRAVGKGGGGYGGQPSLPILQSFIPISSRGERGGSRLYPIRSIMFCLQLYIQQMVLLSYTV